MTAVWYREVPPTPSLRRFIECYWFLRSSDDLASNAQPILPDGRMELVFNLGDPFRRFHPEGRSEMQPSRMLVGQMDHHVTVSAGGLVDVVGVRFHPSGAHPLLGFPMADLTNRLVPLADVVELPDASSLSNMLHAIGIDDRRRALDAMLLPRFEKSASPDTHFERAVQSVVASEGRVSVDGLARDMGVGPRQLERKFRQRVGLGPKRFAKILRFQSVFRRAFLDESPWAVLALDSGYYDQAHFIRDFKSFTGKSPEALFARDNALTRVFTRCRRSGSYNTYP